MGRPTGDDSGQRPEPQPSTVTTREPPISLRRRNFERRQRPRAEVLNLRELATWFSVEPDEVRAELTRRDIPYHEDRSGEIFASARLLPKRPEAPADQKQQHEQPKTAEPP